MSRRFFARFLLGLAVLVLAALAARRARHWWQHPSLPPLAVAPIFADDFAGAPANPITQGRLDPLHWQVQGVDQILQRTQWGLAPQLLKDPDGTTFARLRLETFNPRPDKPGRFHLSTQITSLDKWNLAAGLEVEARLRADHLPRGLVLGFFAYGDAGAWRRTYQKTEADFELLTHQGGEKIWTHLWDNWNPLREGENQGSLQATEGADWNDGSWNTFKIRWYPDHTQWICNNRLIRDERVVRPGSPMGVWFNLWAPNPDWLDAYDPEIQPARTLAQKKTYFYDVDYVRVRRIPVAPAQNAAAEIGHGAGLKASYFASPDLTGRATIRLDPRVDFDWGRYAPLQEVPADGFSARWEGSIQARHSENYRFEVSGNNGARLWVNHRLVVNDWNARRRAPRVGQIALRASEKVPIRLEMFNRHGNARLQLRWSSDSTPPEIVPQSQLYLAARPAPPQFSPSSRVLTRPQLIEIRSPTPGALIRYTLDGKPPTFSSRSLKNGAKLRVSYSTLLRASAQIEGEVPSETARAFYALPDNTPPQVAFASSAPDFAAQTLPPPRGAVSDGGSGVTRLDLVITRLADGLCWKKGRWVKEEWGLGARIRGKNWRVDSGLPQNQNLKPGRYELKAVAYDGAGNVAGARQNLLVVTSPLKK